MKTLEEKMETELNSNLYLSHDFNEIEKDFLRLTKEWLMQKQKEKEAYKKKHQKLKFGAPLYFDAQIDVINELIRDLKK